MEAAGVFYHVLNRGNYRQEVFIAGQSAGADSSQSSS